VVLAKDTVRDLDRWLRSQGQESETMDVDADIPILKRTNAKHAQLREPFLNLARTYPASAN
jgi:hypothetical protein